MTIFAALVVLATVLTCIVAIVYIIYFYAIVSKGQSRDEEPTLFTYPPISVVLPAHNEEKAIYARIRNLVECDYPSEMIELVIVNDASRDNTEEVAFKAMAEYGLNGIIVGNRVRSGVNISMRGGIKEAKNEIVVCTDADVYFEKNALTHIVSKLISEKSIGAVTGDLQPLKGKEATKKGEGVYRSVYSKICEWESNIASTYCFNGALYAIKKHAPTTLDIKNGAYDAGIAFSVIKNGYRALYDSSAKVFENIPNILTVQCKQKTRRAARLIKATWINRDMMSKKNGDFGRVVLPLRFIAFLVAPTAFLICLCLWAYIFSSFNLIFFPLLAVAFLLVVISGIWHPNIVSAFILHQFYLFFGLFRAFGNVDVWKQTERRGEEK